MDELWGFLSLLSMEIANIISPNTHFYNPRRNMNFYLINRFSKDIANSAAFSEQENDKKSQSRLDSEFL